MYLVGVGEGVTKLLVFHPSRLLGYWIYDPVIIVMNKLFILRKTKKLRILDTAMLGTVFMGYLDTAPLGMALWGTAILGTAILGTALMGNGHYGTRNGRFRNDHFGNDPHGLMGTTLMGKDPYGKRLLGTVFMGNGPYGKRPLVNGCFGNAPFANDYYGMIPTLLLKWLHSRLLLSLSSQRLACSPLRSGRSHLVRVAYYR